MSNMGNRRRPQSEDVYADTVVWQCSECDCWSRDEFIYVEQPVCPMCGGEMSQVTKNIRVE